RMAGGRHVRRDPGPGVGEGGGREPQRGPSGAGPDVGAGERLSTTELLATLCGEPWCYTPREAGRLTLYQVNRILFAERDERGAVVVRPKGVSRSDEELFLRTGVRRLVPRWRAAELWREHLERASDAEGGH